MTDRRTFLTGGAAALLTLAGCGGAAKGPGTVTVQATGAPGMNPGPDGSDRPLTLAVLQLRATGAFEDANVAALQSPTAALGADLVSESQIVLAPGGTGTAALELDPSTVAIGLVAGFRDPSGKQVRAVVPVAPGQDRTIAASVTAAGLAAQPA